MLIDPNTSLSANDWRDGELATIAAMNHPDEPCPIEAITFDTNCPNLVQLNTLEADRVNQCVTLVDTLTN